MGMFDSFYFVGTASTRVLCAAGHPQTGEIQTKDLECRMVSYHVFGDEAGNCHVFDSKGLPEGGSQWVREGDVLTETATTFYSLAKQVNGQVLIHTSCDQCEPVYHESGSLWDGGLGSAKPWCEWVLTFEQGRLINIEPLRCETREEVRIKLGKSGCIPLPDDDRIVKKELERWRADPKRTV